MKKKTLCSFVCEGKQWNCALKRIVKGGGGYDSRELSMLLLKHL